MNEHDLETRLRSTYRSRAGRTDPGALNERVHSIPATVEPERRRWWHGFRSHATRSVGLGGTQVRGASNMLTATRIAAIVAALALGTTFLAVQVGDPPDTAQQPAAPTGETWVTVTGTQNRSDGGGGVMVGQMLNMSDPRFEGDVRIEYEQSAPSGGNSTLWSTVTVTNDEGSWVGQSIGFVDELGAHHHMGWFEGAGAYEGLAFIEQLTEPESGISSGAWLDVVGLVYEGELPPMVLPAWAPAWAPATD